MEGFRDSGARDGPARLAEDLLAQHRADLLDDGGVREDRALFAHDRRLAALDGPVGGALEDDVGRGRGLAAAAVEAADLLYGDGGPHDDVGLQREPVVGPLRFLALDLLDLVLVEQFDAGIAADLLAEHLDDVLLLDAGLE